MNRFFHFELKRAHPGVSHLDLSQQLLPLPLLLHLILIQKPQRRVLLFRPQDEKVVNEPKPKERSIKYCEPFRPQLNTTDYTLCRCPNGVRCPYAHGAKEQRYHPEQFKTKYCKDGKTRHACPRGGLCAFWHDAKDRKFAGEVRGLCLM